MENDGFKIFFFVCASEAVTFTFFYGVVQP